MDKQQLLTFITQLSSQNLITKDEVVQAFDNGKEKKFLSLTRNFGLPELMYTIGGFIVIIGITVLISQNWSTLNSFSKILATLGAGVLSYCIGVMLNKEEKYGLVGSAFHLIAATVIPIGLRVSLDIAGYDTSSATIATLISGILFLVYIFSFLIFKKPILTLFSIVYGTWLFFSATYLLFGTNPNLSTLSLNEYESILVGLAYLFIGSRLALSKEQKVLTGLLYSFGTLFFLSATFALGRWKPTQNYIWEILFPFLNAGILYLSTRLKSHAILVFGTIYLMIYILKITGEYFSGTLGWPLSLIICGIILIGIGYYAFTLNKKYLSS